MRPPPPAEGLRLNWSSIPERVRAAFETWARASVVGAESQKSGFSPGVAARLQLSDGQRLFVKALGPEPNPDSPDMHRREGRIVAALPDGVPVPRLRWAFDEGASGWVLLAFEEVVGSHPAQPWRLDELDLVMRGIDDLSQALTPSPLNADAVPTANDRVTRSIRGWHQLKANPPDSLDDWSRRHLDALADLEQQAPDAVRGDTLLHFDVRADNVLLSGNRVWFFDWPHACLGAAWLDVAFFAPSVTMQGGPPPEAVLARSPACREANPAEITAGVAAIAGFFTGGALEPPPPGLPTLRAFQAAQGAVARSWLARRTGWD